MNTIAAVGQKAQFIPNLDMDAVASSTFTMVGLAAEGYFKSKEMQEGEAKAKADIAQKEQQGKMMEKVAGGAVGPAIKAMSESKDENGQSGMQTMMAGMSQSMPQAPAPQ